MTMKELRAVVRPARVPALRDALRALPDFPGVTFWRAEGFTAPSAIEHHGVREELAESSDKMMLSVVCDEAAVPAIHRAIVEACHSGRVGDGLVWVVDAGGVQRIADVAAALPLPTAGRGADDDRGPADEVHGP